MDHARIQEVVNDLSNLILTKGVLKPKITFEIEANRDNACEIHWHEAEGAGLKLEWVFGKTPEETLDRAGTFIRALKSKDERQREEYARAVAAAIDLGRKFGIEDAAINPLREVMEKLSKNVLEHHPAPQRPVDIGDDIPF